ncbi:MAG: PqqD family protein [Chloroflexota bacterium]|nr:PqqD family protein [Chloroflexota bacterium]
MSSLAQPLSRNLRIICRDVGGETMLYDPETESGHVLNATAAAIWRLCDGERDVEAIAAGLERAFDGTATVALQTDVARTLGTLRSLGVVVPS